MQSRLKRSLFLSTLRLQAVLELQEALIIIVAVCQPQLKSTHVRLRVCVCVSVCLSRCCIHDNSKNNGSIHLSFVVYENSSDEFDIRHCQIISRSQCDFEIFLYLPQYKQSSPIPQLGTC